jgi:hypothetical protein
VLDEPESDDEDEVTGVERDDERTGTKYNVSAGIRLDCPENGDLPYAYLDTVLLVPCHLCHGRHVCSWIAHRLVRSRPSVVRRLRPLIKYNT